MNRIASLALAALAAVSLPAGCASLPPLTPFAGPDAEPPERGTALIIGARDFPGDAPFGETEDPSLAGLELFWNRPGEALACELTIQHAYDTEHLSMNRKVEARLTDLQLGLRYRGARAGVFEPYAGAGLALLYARARTSDFAGQGDWEEEWDAGVYVHAGAWAPLSDDVRLGLDLRWVSGDWLGLGDFDLDHGQLALTLGTGF